MRRCAVAIGLRSGRGCRRISIQDIQVVASANFKNKTTVSGGHRHDRVSPTRKKINNIMYKFRHDKNREQTIIINNTLTHSSLRINGKYCVIIYLYLRRYFIPLYSIVYIELVVFFFLHIILLFACRFVLAHFAMCAFLNNSS